MFILIKSKFLILTKFIFILSLLSISINSKATNFKNIEEKNKPNLLKSQKNNNSSANQYILGSGDTLFIEFKDIDIYSKNYIVNPDGNLILPDIDIYKVEGKTLEVINLELKQKYQQYIIDPEISISIVGYRPVSVFILGEVRNPGLYEINYEKVDSRDNFTNNVQRTINPTMINPSLTTNKQQENGFKSPKLFKALTFAKGFTNKADLSKLKVIRNNTQSNGGGKIATEINFLNMLIDGDQSINIRLFDGDTIIVPKSNNPIKEQVFAIQRSNLSPEDVEVFISGGYAREAGSRIMKRGSSLNHAIAAAGGTKLLTGQIEFIRFTYDGKTQKSLFKHDPHAEIDTKKNPILMDGDIINIKRSILGNTTEVLSEISNPLFTGYGIFSLFN